MRRKKTPPSPSMHSILVSLLLTLSGLVTVSATSWNGTSGSITSLKLERIRRHLKKINKSPVRTIQSPDGDVIDCVPKHKQLALDHPLLKNHKIQNVRPKRPVLKNGWRWRNYTMGSPRRAWQRWHHVGHCPKGTVPVRRSSVDDVLRSRSLYHYGKKRRRRHHHQHGHGKGSDERPLPIKVGAPDVVRGNGHEHAIAYTGTSEEVYGVRATINVWEPSIEAENEFSLSQIWILSGSFDGSDLNSIEAGWQVSPELYGDSRPRLFTYWTSDDYQKTGCYNLLCSGFIQTNNKIAIGAAISPVSSLSGDQFDITILIWKDPRLGNWWMSFGDGALVGYWPAELFTHMADHATMVEWGGEVVNMRPNGIHTSTQMGSGQFAEDGFGHASYFRNLELVDSDNSLSSVESIHTLAENTGCYDIRSSSNVDWGTYFYFGGPGSNANCP